MEEHNQGGHKLLGLPPVAWIGLGGLVLVFVYAHGQAAPVVSGVALPATTSTDLSQTQSQAAQLQVAQQQEALAAKTAQDQFALQASQQGLAQSQQAFNTNLFGVQQQQQAQSGANQLALASGQQALSQQATQFAEAQKFEQAYYRNNVHQGGFTLGTALTGLSQAFNSALGALTAIGKLGGAAPAAAAPAAAAAGGYTAPAGIAPGALTTAPFVSPVGIPPTG